ncbi:MAG: Holliday junction branch migration DNA helicase RuvB [Actinobacteria bacterium]|nr:Holliday junction branch migration DNA helicase RuvB [Actinomycetota bacterium]
MTADGYGREESLIPTEGAESLIPTEGAESLIPTEGAESLIPTEGADAQGVGGRDPIVDPVVGVDEGESEVGLRPKRLADFVGQTELKERLDIVLGAARARDQAADHLLFAGPPGLGKTTLAGIIANELDATIHITSGPAIERAGDLAAILTKLVEGDVLFIDEIHRLPKPVEEVLYPAMEDFELIIMIGKGPAAQSIRLELPPFTLVGATTRTGLISGPLRDRFGLVERLDFYTANELQLIVERAAGILNVDIVTDAAFEIARRSRGTPRIANRLLRRVRDFAEVRADGSIDRDVADEGLARFGVDELGLDKIDRAILDNLCRNFGGAAVGLSTLSISIGEQAETVEDVYEPFLIQQGLLLRTPRGRVATAGAYRHLGMEPPRQAVRPEHALGLFD